MANWLARIVQMISRAAEGEYRPGPYYLPISGGWLPADVGKFTNWWQNGYNVQRFGPSAIVEACVSAYSQTSAMLPMAHKWVDPNNPGKGPQRQSTSSLSRVLKKPNEYQTNSDFIMNLVRQLYTDGNAYALAIRNTRFEIAELHLMISTMCRGYPAKGGEIFYQLGGNQVVNSMLDLSQTMVPMRDVLHVRLHTGTQTLWGESPIVATARDTAVVDAIAAQQILFYMNQARPSTVLSTEMQLSEKQVEDLRKRWDEQSRGLATGGTPIMTAGLKPIPMTTNPIDAQLADVMKMSEQHIALAFRIPLQILGLGTGPSGQTEQLMSFWLSTGLGFCLNHVEEAFGKTFALKGYPDEYVEFDESALLRSAMKDRIESLARGVQGGIFAPNEARKFEGLPEVKDGDEPRVQQQVVPLSFAGKVPAAPAPPSQPPAAPVPLPKDNADAVKRLSRQLISSADRIDQRRLLS